MFRNMEETVLVKRPVLLQDTVNRRTEAALEHRTREIMVKRGIAEQTYPSSWAADQRSASGRNWH